jgi:hypothetical protein
MIKRFSALIIVVALSGCATPSQKIAAKLGEFGVPPRQAQCMGDRLQARLSTSQLRRLGEIAQLNRDRLGRMSINDIARQLDDPRDPTVVVEVIRAGVGCAI